MRRTSPRRNAVGPGLRPAPTHLGRGDIPLDICPLSRYAGLSRSAKGRGLETHLDTERVRFLRAGLVTPLPGGLGIDPAGTMTGARGASLWVRSMVPVTPASSRSHEARPGLSRGINLRGKYR